MKKLFSKKFLFIALPLILVAGLAAAGFFLLPRTLQIKISTGSPAEATHPAAAEDGHGSGTTGAGEAAKGDLPTLPYATRERVVNLADKGGYRYLKVEVVLEVALPHSKPGDKLPKGEAAQELQKELEAELAPLKPKLEDAITTVLTSKTADELMTPEGKQRLRDELRAKLDRISTDHPIMGVYFTQFIIQ
jgi:flagellar FliL protein